MVDVLDLLEKEGVVTEGVKAQVLESVASDDVDIYTALEGAGVTRKVILETLGAHYKLPTYLLESHKTIEASVLGYLSEDSARHYNLLPLGVVDGVMEIGITDPDELAALDALNFASAQNKQPYKLVLMLAEDVARGHLMYENLTGEVTEALTELELELSDAIDAKKNEDEDKGKEEEEEESIKEDAPVTKIVATILRYAVDGDASDIHVEPLDNRVQVRFRIDGILTTSLELPKKIHSATVARIKILCSMRLDEKRKPQDGRFSATIDGRRIDFRVSTLPTNFGEKVVMRILDPDGGVRDLGSTGISDHNLALIRDAIQRPYGIILISGPTGSGKSTTLYGLLGEVDRIGKNVISLEDPVEFNIDGVSQSQVRPEIGYTFADGTALNTSSGPRCHHGW